MSGARIPESALSDFIVRAFRKLSVPEQTAALAARSLLDASLMGIDTHGIEALEMYLNHLRSGGLSADADPIRVQGGACLELWDMQHGFGLAAGRQIMAHAVGQAREQGAYLATCRNANHLGACGVYAKLAADEGLIGVVSQQTLASLAPPGGAEPRVGASPFAFAAPVKDGFPFCFDASMAAMTRGQIKAHRRANRPLPSGVALDAEGRPTTDPEKAWHGQIMPIGGHKGFGLAMAFEILSSVLSGNQLAADIPSIVNTPDRSADSGVFMMAIDPHALMARDAFAGAMGEYVGYVESSTTRDPADPPRYPGRRAGEHWEDRARNGIPVSEEAQQRFDAIAESLGVQKLAESRGEGLP